MDIYMIKTYCRNIAIVFKDMANFWHWYGNCLSGNNIF